LRRRCRPLLCIRLSCAAIGARTYWIVTHQDTCGLGRIRAVCEHLVASVTRDRAMFV
jgi:hypothetical protein